MYKGNSNTNKNTHPSEVRGLSTSEDVGLCGVLIGAATSNSGKTTLTMGLLRALRNKGLNVQPFKCGPDYIDTMFHEIASGNESVNLDTFMSSMDHVRHLFEHYGKDADISVVEGVMGLFDGYSKDHGSSAEIAQLLDIPVILVVNAKSVAYSVAPIIYGFKHFNENIRIEGVIFNMVASESHYSFLKAACEDAGVPCLGYLPHNERLVIPGRHLGLTITAKEETEQLIALAAEEVEKHVDLDRIISLNEEYRMKNEEYRMKNEEYKLHLTKKTADNSNPDSSFFIPSPTYPSKLAPSPNYPSKLAPSPTYPSKLALHSSFKIAVARDEAFNFTYRANIDAMSAEGEVVFFSPMRDSNIPNCDLLYLPGGYPELFADQLTANESMRKSIRDFAQHNGKIFAECGGFMYLCHDIDGKEMCGVLPFHATMQGAKLHLGYRQCINEELRIKNEECKLHLTKKTADNSNPNSSFFIPNSSFSHSSLSPRGHEFHYSHILLNEKMPDDITITEHQSSAQGREVNTALYRYKNVIAGYTHWYWAETGFTAFLKNI